MSELRKPILQAGIPVPDYATLGAQLAHEHTDTQASFVRAFVRELLRCCDTYHRAEMQLAGARVDWRTDVTQDEWEVLKMLTHGPFKETAEL